MLKYYQLNFDFSTLHYLTKTVNTPQLLKFERPWCRYFLEVPFFSWSLLQDYDSLYQGEPKKKVLAEAFEQAKKLLNTFSKIHVKFSKDC